MAGSRGGGYRDVFIDGFVPPSTSVAPIFPYIENTSEWDDFGEVIDPDDYVINDEDMDHTAMHVSFLFSCCSFDFGQDHFYGLYWVLCITLQQSWRVLLFLIAFFFILLFLSFVI